MYGLRARSGVFVLCFLSLPCLGGSIVLIFMLIFIQVGWQRRTGWGRSGLSTVTLSPAVHHQSIPLTSFQRS